MDADEVVELCEDFFNSLEGEEDYWIEIRGRTRPALKLVEVDVDEDRERIVLVVEPVSGLDDDDPELAEMLDKAIAALVEEHEDLSDFRVTYRIAID
jgi:hypothetical protein